MSAPTHTAPPFGRAIVAVTMFAGLAWAGDAVALVMTLDGASIVPVATVTAVVAATLTVAVLAIWVLSRIQRDSRPARAVQSGIDRGIAAVRAFAPGLDVELAGDVAPDVRPEPAMVTRAFDLGRRIGRRDVEPSGPRS